MWSTFRIARHSSIMLGLRPPERGKTAIETTDTFCSRKGTESAFSMNRPSLARHCAREIAPSRPLSSTVLILSLYTTS